MLYVLLTDNCEGSSLIGAALSLEQAQEMGERYYLAFWQQHEQRNDGVRSQPLDSTWEKPTYDFCGRILTRPLYCFRDDVDPMESLSIYAREPGAIEEPY